MILASVVVIIIALLLLIFIHISVAHEQKLAREFEEECKYFPVND